ncbi:MAG TPA: hypothetical protein VHE34_20985 [Puia sp.]|uniref:hypothetical protein n=1 Tax=Puia sp. TaxID=2045100 RepID=UPI002C0E71A2|nr:hypothetical protein [Puia sp.]HVU97718.1 hypothetical protein [Puia sp.]
MKHISILGVDCTIEFDLYRNKTVAMTAIRATDGEEWCVLTVNYERFFEGKDYSKHFVFPLVVIKNGDINQGVYEDLVRDGAIESGPYLSGTGRTVQVGRLTPEWQTLARQQLKLPPEPGENTLLK